MVEINSLHLVFFNLQNFQRKAEGRHFKEIIENTVMHWSHIDKLNLKDYLITRSMNQPGVKQARSFVNKYTSPELI